MAKTETPANEAVAAEATEGKRKRRAPSGPRKQRPLHAAVRVLTADGTVLEGYTIEIAKTSRDVEDILAITDHNAQYKRVKFDLAKDDAEG